MKDISEYWKFHGATLADRKHGRTFEFSDGTLSCDECCNGDRCDDPNHTSRASCSYCLGTIRNLSCLNDDGTLKKNV